MAVNSFGLSVRFKLLTGTLLFVLCALTVGMRLKADDIVGGEVMSAAVAAISCILLFLLAQTIHGEFAPTLPHGLPSVTFGASVAGVLLLSSLPITIYTSYFLSSTSRLADDNVVISAVVKLLALLAAVYFLLTAAYMSLPNRKSMHLLLAMTPILYFAFQILSDFINTRTMPLANAGGYRLLALIAVMLYFLCEGKFLLGRGSVTLLLATGMIAVLLSVSYDIPSLVSCLRSSQTEGYVFRSIQSLGVCLYILSRMFSLPSAERSPA